MIRNARLHFGYAPLHLFTSPPPCTFEPHWPLPLNLNFRLGLTADIATSGNKQQNRRPLISSSRMVTSTSRHTTYFHGREEARVCVCVCVGGGDGERGGWKARGRGGEVERARHRQIDKQTDTHTQIHSHTHTLSLSHTQTHTDTHRNTHTHSLSLSHFLTHTHFLATPLSSE